MNDHHFVYFRFNDVERFHWLVKIQSASRTDRLVDPPVRIRQAGPTSMVFYIGGGSYDEYVKLLTTKIMPTYG